MKRLHIISLSAAIVFSVSLFIARPATAATQVFPNVGAQGDIILVGSKLWYVGGTLHTVTRFDPTINTVERTFTFAADVKPTGLVAVGTDIWVTDSDATGGSKLIKIASNDTTTEFIVPFPAPVLSEKDAGLRQITTDGTNLYVIRGVDNADVPLGGGAYQAYTHLDYLLKMNLSGAILSNDPQIACSPSQWNNVVGGIFYDSQSNTLKILKIAQCNSRIVTDYLFFRDSNGIGEEYEGNNSTLRKFFYDSLGSQVWGLMGSSVVVKKASSPTEFVTEFTDSVISGGVDLVRVSSYIYMTLSNGGLARFDEPTLAFNAGPAASNITQTAADVSWSTNVPTTKKFSWRQQGVGSLIPNDDLARFSSTWTVPLSGLTGSTTYEYRIFAQTPFGQLLSSGFLTFQTQSLPTINITNIQVTNIGSNTATVSWRTPISTSSNYVTRGAVITSATNSFNGTDYTHTALLSRLDSSLLYSVTLISQQSGYTAGTAPASFTTIAPYTVTATPTGTRTVSQGALATFTITVNPAFDFLFTSSLDLATNPVLANSAQTFSPPILTSSQRSSTLTFTTTALTIGPTYSVPVTVTCSFCNPVFTATVTPSFVVSATPAVTITAGPTWTQLSPTSVRIDWTTLQAADSLVDYGVNQAYALGPVINASLVGAPQQHQITLTGLFAGQTYHYRVKSRLAGFTDAVSIDQTFATTLPTITIFNAKVSYVGAFSVNVSWQTSVPTSTNLASLGTQIEPAGTGTIHTLPVPLNGLASTTQYTVYISSGQTGYATAQTQVVFTTLAPFTASVAPAVTQNVTQGALATFNITVVPASDLSFATLPLATNPALDNSTQTFSFPDIKPSQLSSTLTFTTDALTIGPTYNVPVTITCNSCDPVYTATVTASFKVGAPVPACELSLTPPSTNVMPGTTGTLQLQLTPLNGFASTMNLSNISPDPAYPKSKLYWDSFIGDSASLQKSVRIDTSNVPPGDYKVKFHARDPVGTVVCDSQVVTVTVGPPDFTITAVPSSTQTVSKNQFADYEFQVRPIGTFAGSVQVSILQPNDGTAWPAGTYSPIAGAFDNAYGNMAVRVNTTTMAEGTYWAKVRATSGIITHEIDPVELIVGPPGMCDDGETADQTCSTTRQWCDLSVSPSGSLSNNCVTNGDKCRYQCADPQTCNRTTGNCVGDTTPPVISPPQCLTTIDSATITWTTDEPANSEVLWRKSTEPLPYLNSLGTDPLPIGATSHVVPIPQNGQLSPSTLYYVKVKSTDNQNNTAESAEISCTTKATADTQAPVVKITFPLSGATIVGSTAVRADASDNNGVVRVEFLTNGPNGTASINADTTLPYEVNWDVVGLPSGAYALTAKATDAAGNIGVSPQVMVNVNNDTLAPKILNFLPIHNVPSQYTVTWTTDELATSWVYYCLEPANGGACTYDKRAPVNGTAWSMNHRIVLDGLLLNRNYRLTPISCDAAGNCNNTKPF